MSVSSCEDVADRADLLLAVVVGDLEHGALGPLDEIAGGGLAGQHARLDLVRGRQQRPHLRVVADDPPVLPCVARGGDPARELVDRLGAADLVELAVLLQRLGDRQVVDLAVALVQRQHRREHGAVLLAVEVLGPQLLLDQQRVQVALVEQHRPEHRLLGLEVVGRDGDVRDGAHGRGSESRFEGGGSDGARSRTTAKGLCRAVLVVGRARRSSCGAETLDVGAERWRGAGDATAPMTTPCPPPSPTPSRAQRGVTCLAGSLPQSRRVGGHGQLRRISLGEQGRGPAQVASLAPSANTPRPNAIPARAPRALLAQNSQLKQRRPWS